MKFASVRDLKNNTSSLLRLVGEGKNVLITSHGKPVAMLHGVSEEDLEDYIISSHPGIRESLESAHEEHKKKGGVSLSKAIGRVEKKLGKIRG